MNFKTFYINSPTIWYQELPSDHLLFQKYYLIENPDCEEIFAIPDGCIDLQFTWENGACRGFVCGSFLRSKRSRVGASQRCFGLKLRAGTLLPFFTSRISEMIDSRIALNDFIDVRQLEAELSIQTDFQQMIQSAMRFFGHYPMGATHVIARSAARMICDQPGACRVSDMIADLGYSHRYVDAVFKNYFGISVKKYSDIVRAQTAIDYLNMASAADVVSALGYYDQAHFIRDFKQYTTLTPRSFVEQSRSRKLLIV